MKHLEEDTIYKFALELLDDEELKKVSDHLKVCKNCSAKLIDIEKQIELIGSYNPEFENSLIPISSKKNNYSVWLTRAAVLVIGFLLGYTASLLMQSEHVMVVEQHLVSQNLPVAQSDFIECPNVDIY